MKYQYYKWHDGKFIPCTYGEWQVNFFSSKYEKVFSVTATGKTRCSLQFNGYIVYLRIGEYV